MVMTPTTSTTCECVLLTLPERPVEPGGYRHCCSAISLYRSWKDLVQGGGCHPLSAYPIRNGKWDWACMGFHSSTDERALRFVFRLLDGEDVLSVKLPVGWQTSRVAVCSGEAKVTTEDSVVTVDILGLPQK